MQPEYPNYDYTAINLEREAQNRRTLVRTVLAVITALVVLFALWVLVLNKRSVTLAPAKGTTISIGTVAVEEDGGNIRTLITRTSSEKTIRLKPGTYAILFSGNGYEDIPKDVTIDSNITIKTPAMQYTQDKLNTILGSERDAIRARLFAGTNLVGYTPDQEKLYDMGEWYSAQLMPDNINTQDKLVVIMHKENGEWKVVAKPSLIFFTLDYPNIPTDVIRTVNNQSVILPPPAS